MLPGALGAALLQPGRSDEAERPLPTGCEGMRARAQSIPAAATWSVAQAVNRLSAYYGATGREDLVGPWRRWSLERWPAGN